MKQSYVIGGIALVIIGIILMAIGGHYNNLSGHWSYPGSNYVAGLLYGGLLVTAFGVALALRGVVTKDTEAKSPKANVEPQKLTRSTDSFCPYCGAVVKIGHSFCQSCGKKIE